MCVSRDEVIRRLSYDAKTGVFIWVQPKSCVPAGSRAGVAWKDGYRRITLNKKTYAEHRLAWLIHYGQWPTLDIDHINRKRDDNRIVNLREATPKQNAQNRMPTGVTWHKSAKKWQAQIKVAGVAYYLGLHDSEDNAKQAYMNAKRRLHTFMRDGETT